MELFYATLIFLIGLGVLISGAEIFIHHSAQLGAKLGISDVIIGITLVALGTSIPEIFVSISPSTTTFTNLAVMSLFKTCLSFNLILPYVI